MLKKFVRIVGGDPNQKEIDKYKILVDQINQLESTFERLSDAELSSKTNEFKFRLASGQTLDDLLVDVFAVVREASKRSLGMRHFDVQLIGGIALHQGKIAEMRTGEGKTLVATLPLYLNALTGRGVHLVTVNDYLARRDARWMAPIYNMLGLSVGVLQMAARTENGKKAFIVDLERQSPHEDQNQLQMVVRQQAYLADITYGTNSEFGFDYLRDNMTMRLEERVQRGFNFAIVDEVDNVLIDEARTPLIISGPAQDEAEWYIRTSQVVKRLQPEDYEINEKDRTVYLTEIGEIHVEELLGVSLRDPDRPEDITPEQARLLGYLEQSLRAQFLYSRNKEYLVQAGKVVIVDEFTGRLMPGRRWSDGLHQAVEAKEGVKVQSESVTYASITIQNYFRMYEKLAGMTGTAVTESEEFNEIYSLNVLAIPTNLEYIAAHPDTDLVELEDRDEQGYRYYYYAKNNDPENQPVFWKRKDYPDVVYRTEETKLRAITQEILRYHVLGRPLLVGTTSVELSDRVSNRLRSEPLRRLTQILLIRDVWMKKHDQEPDGRQIPELLYLNQPLNHLDTNQMRRSAQELGISFNPEDSDNIDRLLEILNLSSTEKNRLINDLKGGIPHQVLNARKHTEESQIIASAGSFGAVTIATNMAGRGVDIRLGGEVAEEILTSVYRVLSRAGYEKPYELTLEERRQALEQMDQADYGIYGTEINYFLRYLDEMNQVRKLGGLHVIGSERHEARRIDNQLRGRSARQGDPGSSRFYLSMEDELMRLFGGQQADGLMQRLKIDDALPLEVGLVSRLVEQSQGRVEGANFDVRKHLLEYDDVLNTQRARIYDQRNRIFKKDDLKEDVTEMLRVEVKRRIPETMNDEAGPWRLLSWLDQIQPPISVNGIVFPPFSIQQLADEFLSLIPANPIQDLIRESLITIVRQSVDSERSHVLQTIRELLEQTQNRLEIQIAERLETLETFIEGLSLEEDNDHRPLSDILADLSEAIHYPIKLSNSEQKLLFENPQKLEGIIREQIETTSRGIALTRLSGAIERRLEEPLDLKVDIVEDDWFLIEEKILSRVDELYENRINRYVNGDAQISREIDYALDKLSGQFDRQSILQILLGLPQGARASFDKKTHKRVWQKTTRFTYFYYVADLLHSKELETINDQVLKHLENAQEFISRIWGQAEIKRLARYSIQDLNEQARRGFLNALGEADFSIIENQPFEEINHTHRERVIQELGRQTLTEIYRQLLLSVTTELWVEYLTQMEALRVSIGLEAYARQDPLVQYKNKAYGLFQELLDNMRLSVVSRMFTFRPREVSKLQTDSESETQFIEAISPSESISDNDQPTADSEEVILVEEAESGTDDKSPQKAVGNLTSTSKKRRHRYRRK